MLRRSLLLKYRRNTKMRKWISMLSMVLVITLAGSLKASAEVRVMPDGQLFDPEFYGQFNTDVAAIFGSDADTLYWHYLKAGKVATRIKETLARTLHDHSMSNALYDFLKTVNERKVIGIMGGHGLLRTEAAYRQIVHISKRLTENHYLMINKRLEK